MDDKKRILIVEDEIFIRELYEDYLTKRGYEVLSAEDGEKGLQLAQDEKVQLILLDVMLPKMTGIDVLKHVKEGSGVNKEVPLYMLTNLGQDSVIKQAFTLGAAGYLIKSQLTPQQLADQIAEILKA